MSTEPPVNNSKYILNTSLEILDRISDSVTIKKSHIGAGALVWIICCFDWYCKSIIFPSHLLFCWVYVSLDIPMMQKLLIILYITVPGIDYSLAFPYIHSDRIPCSLHISIRPIPPSEFDFIGFKNTNSLEVNTCASLYHNSDGEFTYKGYV